MANNQKIYEFISVTGADEERARFYLNSAGWELHTALETFYDNDITEDINYVEQPLTRKEKIPAPNYTSSETPKQSPSSRSGSSRFATLAQYQKEGGSSDEEGQAFYAGGSERSGQQIIGPNKKTNPTQALFDAAKQHGAEVVREESVETKGPNKGLLFKGTGFKLGSDIEPSQQVSAALFHKDQPVEPQNVKIKFWKNGFSVDEGPLRDFLDRENKEFLDAIKRGEVPAELRRQTQNGEVHVDMEDHRDQDYVQPKVSLKPFTGEGHKLGSPAPAIASSGVPLAAVTAVPTHQRFKVDESRPVTTIQIRLYDGTRLVCKFNHDNTIRDIKDLVRNAKPGTKDFNLMTLFPNKVLVDDSATIADAQLLNSVIVQRLT